MSDANDANDANKADGRSNVESFGICTGYIVPTALKTSPNSLGPLPIPVRFSSGRVRVPSQTSPVSRSSYNPQPLLRTEAPSASQAQRAPTRSWRVRKEDRGPLTTFERTRKKGKERKPLANCASVSGEVLSLRGSNVSPNVAVKRRGAYHLLGIQETQSVITCRSVTLWQMSKTGKRNGTTSCFACLVRTGFHGAWPVVAKGLCCIEQPSQRRQFASVIVSASQCQCPSNRPHQRRYLGLYLL